MNKIIGRKPVLEALNSDVEIEIIYFARGLQGDVVQRIKNIAKSKSIKTSEIPAEKLNTIAGNANHQGIAALASETKYFELDELITASKNSKYPLLLLLDSIQDPHNIGAILRTAECAGVDGIVTTVHNSASFTDTVQKVSAGALSLVKICKVNNLVNAIEELKKSGFWVVGSSLEKSRDYDTVDYKMPVALVLGNEEKGIRRLVADKCDFIVKIPMTGRLQSLNVSVASGILLFEILRQRKGE